MTPLNDVVDGLAELVRVLTEPGDGVIVNPPVYHPFFPLIEQAGRSVVDVPLGDGGRLDLDGIERAFAGGARALILCNPHNPTGTVPERDELERVAEIAAAHDGWVLADEIHASLVLPGAEHTGFLGLGGAAAERGIALTSASKAFNLAGAQVRAGDHRRRAGRASGSRACPRSPPTVATSGRLATVAAYRDGDQWLDAVIARLDSNRRLLAELLAERLPEVGYERAGRRVTSPGSTAARSASATTPRDRSASAAGSRSAPGPRFGAGGEGFARLNFATSPELLTETVERMAAAVGR